jgi:uncharacterized RDD family membrane protein YckC
MPPETFPNAGLLRRFAAMLYDGFLVIAIWMTSTTLLVALVTDGAEVIGFLYQVFLYLELTAFYIFFWRFKGQTLGMQVWKIQLVDSEGELLTYKACVLRFITATLSLVCAGLGFFWMYFNKERLTFHDIASKSHVIYLGKNPYRSEMS